MMLLIAGVAVVALILAIKIGHAILRLAFGLIGVAVIVGAVWWFSWNIELVKSCILHCRWATRSAFCMSGAGQIRLQKACADSPRHFPRIIRIAPQAVAGRALVEFSTAVALR